MYSLAVGVAEVEGSEAEEKADLPCEGSVDSVTATSLFIRFGASG